MAKLSGKGKRGIFALTALAYAGTMLPVFAEEAEPADSFLTGGQWAVGGVLGNPTGLTVSKTLSETSWADLGIGWGIHGGEDFTLNAGAHWTFVPQVADQEWLALSVGGAAYWQSRDGDDFIGPALPITGHIRFIGKPYEATVTVAPASNWVDFFDFEPDWEIFWGIGVKFWLE